MAKRKTKRRGDKAAQRKKARKVRVGRSRPRSRVRSRVRIKGDASFAKQTPLFKALLLDDSDITANGFSRVLEHQGILRFSSKKSKNPDGSYYRKVSVGKRFNLSSLGLTLKKIRGVFFRIQVVIEWKDERGKLNRDFPPGVPVRPAKKWKDTRENIPQALLSSFLFALDRNNLRGDYTAYFRKRVGEITSGELKPKTRRYKVQIWLYGFQTKTKNLNR